MQITQNRTASKSLKEVEGATHVHKVRQYGTEVYEWIATYR